MYDPRLKKQLSVEETNFIINADFICDVRAETEETVEHQGNSFYDW
jgi:hypothetical protein